MIDPLINNNNRCDDELLASRFDAMKRRVKEVLKHEKDGYVKKQEIHKNTRYRATPFKKCRLPKEGYGGKTPEEIFRIFREYCDKCSESGEDELFTSLDGRLTDKRIDDVIAFACERGLVFSREEYLKISKIAREVKNFKLYVKQEICKDQKLWDNRHTLFAPLALNNYDYEELLKEVANLKKVLDDAETLGNMCGKLLMLIDETEKTKNSDYPGRHLPFDKLKGQKKGSMARYKRLRILDELLYKGCTERHYDENREFMSENSIHISEVKPWLTKDIIKAFKEDAAVLGILDDINISWLNRDFVALSELIMVNHSGEGRRQKALLGAYDYVGGVKGHIYRKAHDDGEERVTAFMMTFNIDEAIEMEYEIDSVKNRFFRNSHWEFNKTFPLLDALSNISEMCISKMISGNEITINDVSHTDFMTVNYMRHQMLSLKHTIGKSIMHSEFMALKQSARARHIWKIVEPTGIGPDTLWNFRAIAPETGEENIYNISDFSDYYTIDKRNVLINKNTENQDINSLYSDRLWKIKLKLDANYRSSEAPYVLDEVCLKLKVPHPSFFEMSEINFDAYVNDALMLAIWKLDKCGVLLDIKPMEVSSMYENYVEETKKSKTGFRKTNAFDESHGEGFLFSTAE